MGKTGSGCVSVLAICSLCLFSVGAHSQPGDGSKVLAAAERAGDYARAANLSEKAVKQLEAKGERRDLAKALAVLGRYRRAEGRLLEAQQQFERAIGLYEAINRGATPEAAEILIELADTLLELDRVSEGQALADRASAVLQTKTTVLQTKTKESDHRVARALSVQARAKFKRMQLAEATALARQSLQLSRQYYGPDHSISAIRHTELGDIRRLDVDLSGAEQELVLGLAILERRLSQDHPEVVRARLRLAELRLDRRQYKQAEQLLERTRASAKRTLSPTHPLSGDLLALLAECKLREHYFAAAEDLLKRSIEVRDAAYGSRSSKVADVLVALAKVYRMQRRYDDAERALKSSAEIRRDLFGADDDGAVPLWIGLGQLAEQMERHEEAAQHYERARGIWQRILGRDHPVYASALVHLGDIRRKQHRYSDAEALYQEALRVRIARLGNNDDRASSIYLGIGLIQYRFGRWAEAANQFQQALAIEERLFGPDHFNVAEPLLELANARRREDRNSESEALYLRTIRIKEARFGVDNDGAADALNNYAMLLDNVAQYDKAIDYYQRAKAINERLLGPSHPSVAFNLSNIAYNYNKRGRDAEAKDIIENAIAMHERGLGPDDFGLASLLGIRASILAALKEYPESFADYERQTRINEKWLGRHSAAVASSLANHGNALRLAERYREALPLYEEALRIREELFGPDDEATALMRHNYGLCFYNLNMYRDAEQQFARTLRINEHKFGRANAYVATNLSYVADTFRRRNRDNEAVPLYEEAIAIREKLFGKDDKSGAWIYNNLGLSLEKLRRFEAAETVYRRALALYRLAGNYDFVAKNYGNLGDVYRKQRRFSEAEANYQLAIDLRAEHFGPRDAGAAWLFNNIAVGLEDVGHFSEAEAAYLEALAIDERQKGSASEEVATRLYNLADLYDTMARYVEAETLFRRALQIREEVLGREHGNVAEVLSGLGLMLDKQGRNEEAIGLLRRAVNIREASPPDTDFVLALSFLGSALNSRSRSDEPEAEKLFRRAIAIAEEINFSTAIPTYGLAVNLEDQGRHDEAERLYLLAIQSDEERYGPNDPEVAISVDSLGDFHRKRGKFEDALASLKRAHAIFEQAYGRDHPSAADSVYRQARVHFQQGNWEEAYAGYREAAQIYVARRGNNLRKLRRQSAADGRDEVDQNRDTFLGFIRSAYRLSNSPAVRDRDALREEAFQAAQWVTRSAAAAALTRTAARLAAGEGDIRPLIRQRQDLDQDWQVIDKRLLDAAIAPSAESNEELPRLRGRKQSIDDQIREIDERLAREFPTYDALFNETPASIAEARKLLRGNEALIQIIALDEELIVLVVTATDAKWALAELGSGKLADQVATLRCGLDDEQWVTASGAARCAGLLALEEVPDKKQPLPFHLGVAHELYRAVFAQLEDVIKGKRLLIVPSGPLSSVPLHVLVTKKPNSALPESFEGYRDVAWLAREYPVTVLPSVSSLKALRDGAIRAADARADYIGFGNPRLEGGAHCARTLDIPDACPTTAAGPPVRVVSANDPAPGRATIRGRGTHRSVSIKEIFSRGASSAAVLENVRKLCPLPDTAFEINCVAATFQGDKREIYLDEGATEATIKSLSEAGTLARYRIVHFATHGLLAGEMAAMAKRQAEPALIMTPPDFPVNDDDNGLLTASEIAQLKLDADWVVLSACNTAASANVDAEALSGLARAFFYAQARALLVSHWPVYSDAAVRLTTMAFAELETDPAIGRAKALQRAMIGLMDDDRQDDNAHPAVWAPFVVVGDADP